MHFADHFCVICWRLTITRCPSWMSVPDRGICFVHCISCLAGGTRFWSQPNLTPRPPRRYLKCRGRARSRRCNAMDSNCRSRTTVSITFIARCSCITSSTHKAVELLREMNRVARRRIFVVDLHRSPIGYYFFQMAGRILFQRFTREDGALSILRSFVPHELSQLAADAGLADVNVSRSWAYRLVLSGNKLDG